jgi:hypothetical protein
MLQPHCKWNRFSSTTIHRLFQELRADVRPPVGPIGTPYGNGIRRLG